MRAQQEMTTWPFHRVMGENSFSEIIYAILPECNRNGPLKRFRNLARPRFRCDIVSSNVGSVRPARAQVGKVRSMRKLPVVCAIALGGIAAWSADWLTDGGNVQRTAWQKDEKIFTTANVKDTKLLWKIKLDNEVRQMHSIFPPLIVEKVNTPAGAKQIAIVAGVSDNIFAIDVETGQQI